MSYIVFARKYRPKDFEEITGQSHITTTLKNAITHDRVAHAYLFAGPRGVGKTTTARILAKALNCEKGPTTKPCNKCASCLEIASGSSLDIFEIDGASNNGIDQIRSLRENAKFTPVKGRFKIYIIDEVHMLSGEAFNALLKTLEEPPPHVKFILATTHAHKVPPTVLSRCQRFDFRRIPTKEILESLHAIAKKESLSINENALRLIAKYGEGSMRDSQVMLDQIVSFTQGSVSEKDVAGILGIVDNEVLFAISEAVSGKDSKSALNIVGDLTDGGKDLMQVVLGLIEHFRNIAVAKVSKDPGSLIDSAADEIKRYCESAGNFTIEQILYIIYTLSNTIDFMRKTSLARIPFEAALVKLTQNSGVVPMADIIKRIEALEGGMLPSAPAQAVAAVTKTPDKLEPVKTFTEPIPAPPVPSQKSSDQAPQTSNLNEILSSWAKVINYIKAKKMSIAHYLQEGSPISLDGGVITIGFAGEHKFHKETLESNDNRKLIEQAVKETLGLDVKIALAVSGADVKKYKGDNGYIADPEDGDNMKDPSGEESDPIVKKAIEMFGGKRISESNKGRAH